MTILGLCSGLLGLSWAPRGSPQSVASVLKVEFSGGELLTYGPGPRAALMDRARGLVDSGASRARYFIDGELLDLSRYAPDAGLRPDSEPAPFQARVEGVEAGARERHADEVSAEELDQALGGAPLSLDDAARLSEQFLRNAVTLSERMIDRAAERGLEALERLAAMQEKQAEAQQRQAETLFAQGAEVQKFVGALVATVAEERLAAVRIRSSDKQMLEAEALRVASRDVQLAKINAERDIHLAQINRPSAVGALLEFAAVFAAQYAQNAAVNFAEMNDFKPGETN